MLLFTECRYGEKNQNFSCFVFIVSLDMSVRRRSFDGIYFETKQKKNESRKEMNVVGCTRDRGRIPTKESFNLRNRRRRRKNHFFSGTIFDNDKLMTLCTEGMAPGQTKTRNKKIEEDTPPVRHSVESAEWNFFLHFFSAKHQSK